MGLCIIVAGACTGPAGTPAIDTGSIAGTAKDATGAPLVQVSVSTDPASSTTQTDSTGAFVLSAVRIGSYTVVASRSGYQNTQVEGVGVAGGATTHVALVLAPAAGTPGSLSGFVFGRQGTPAGAIPIVGAQVCLEGSSNCTTSVADGGYTLDGVPVGPAFISASANGFLAGETRQAAVVTAGETVTGVSVTLSGQPPAQAAYIGSNQCLRCHVTFTPDLVAAWNSSAHHAYTDRSLQHVDVSGWPAAPANCNAPSVTSSGVPATDPAHVDLPPVNVLLVRWGANCGAAKPAFAMAFDSNGNGRLDPGETLMPVTGTFGGVASEAGACGNGGVIPSSAQCAANYVGAGATGNRGWWQQEYAMSIAPGTKPAWVTWDTSQTPTDLMVLPLAWNQRSAQWVNGSDYSPGQAGTFDAVCGACHETGISLTTDVNGTVTSYSSVDPLIGCEKCHGPGSAHAVGGDARLIVNPKYLTAQSAREVCGQCHTNVVTSTNPAGVFDYAWNNQADAGGGNFIPGVHRLSDFLNIPAFGDPSAYFATGFPNIDHTQYMDLSGSAHVNNNYEKVACQDCHDPHGGIGGPYQFQRKDAQSGDQYVFQNNTAALLDDVVCLGCHATHGPFSSVALADVANYHISAGGAALKNGAALSPTAQDQGASTNTVTAAVNSHMQTAAGMPAYFDPLGTSGLASGRCSSCHMAMTSSTAQFYSGVDPHGHTANVIGDVSSHTFKVALPQDSLASWSEATTWSDVMPNACGSCHPAYLLGK